MFFFQNYNSYSCLLDKDCSFQAAWESFRKIDVSHNRGLNVTTLLNEIKISPVFPGRFYLGI